MACIEAVAGLQLGKRFLKSQYLEATMAFCASCGTPVEGAFCAKCGTPASGSAPPPNAPAAAGMADNVAGTLCYVLGFITGILFLVLAPYNQNKAIRFHAFQSIFLHIAFIIIWIGAGIVLPWSISLVLTPLIGLGGFGLWLYVMWQTYQNQRVKLPLIGDLAEKQA